MIESELESIKNKLKSDEANSDININIMEKKLLKLEKKLIQLEYKMNNITKSEHDSDSESEQELDSDSELDYDVNTIIKELDLLEKELNQFTQSTQSDSIEKLLDIYIKFKTKLDKVKIKNNDFKLSIEYL